jgi:polar amino acid transport system substrate-binding protein
LPFDPARMRALTRLVCCGLALAAALFGPAAKAAPPAPAPAPCGPYKLAFYAYGLLYFTDAQGRPAGIDKDIVDELARRTGCVFEPVVESRVRIWDQLQRGAIQITLSGNPTPAREAFAEFVPYAQSRYFVLMWREAAARISRLFWPTPRCAWPSSRATPMAPRSTPGCRPCARRAG